MTRRIKLVDKNAEHRATRVFIMDGEKYQPGDKIDVQAILDKPRGIHQFERLVKHRFIAAEGTEHRRNKSFRRHTAKQVEKPVEKVDQTDTSVEKAEQTDTPVDNDTTTVELKHTGAGYYKLVDADGVNHIPNDETVQGKDAARAIAAQLGLTVA